VDERFPGNHAESIYAVWHDPTTYDHLRMGPPYLPDASTLKAVGRPKQGSNGIPDSDSLAEVKALIAKEAADEEVASVLAHFLLDYGQQSFGELAALLACMRAVNLVHQTHHWQTRGPQFYGDHLMFERLYNETLEMIDTLAERTVGSGTPSLVNPVIQSTHVLLIIKSLYNGAPMEATPDQCALLSLKGVLRSLVLLQLVYGVLEKKQMLSHGTDNMLQGIADKQEDFVYLLKQRVGGDARLASQPKVARDASAWKAT
jgi:DNA-binding ferritin-like protein